VPIIPVALRGTGDLMPAGGLRIHGGGVRVRVGAPLDPAQAGSVDELSSQVRAAIQALAAIGDGATPR
jgi:1-acyl-sn-glycerol-3-phosphate acyltransferase